MYTDDGAYTFGSTKNLNNLIQGSTEDSSSLSPQFTILNNDVNNDGKVDQLEIKIQFNADGSKIRNIAVLQTVIYSISDEIEADIKVRMMNDFDTPNGVSKLAVQGTIDLLQKQNFAIGKVEREIGFELENDLAILLRRENIMDFMMQKFSKNTTAEFKVQSTYITTSSNNGADQTELVEIRMLIDVPVLQQIRYSPTFLQKASQCFTQYMALLIPSVFFFYEILLGGALKRKILSSKVWSEIKRAQQVFGTKLERNNF